MTTSMRQELIEGIRNDLYDFSLVDANEKDKPEPIYTKIFRSAPIKGSAEVSNTALLNVTFKDTEDGESIEYTDAVSGRKFTHRTHRITAAQKVPRDLIDRDAVKPELKAWAQKWVVAAKKAHALRLETYFANLLNYSGYTSGNAIFNQTSGLFTYSGGNFVYDGKPLVNLSGNDRTLTKKPADKENSFHNGLGATLKPLSTENFDAAYTLMSATNAYNDAGQKISRIPTHVIYHPTDRGTAFSILKTTSGVPGDVNNGANHNFEIVDPIMNPYITSGSWFLYRNSGAFLAFDQGIPYFDFWFDQETKEHKISMDVSYGHGIDDVLDIVGGNNATS